MDPPKAVPAASPGRPRPGHASAQLHATQRSTGSVLVVVLVMTVLTYLVSWVSPVGGELMDTGGWLLAGEALKLALWLFVLGLLGWWRVGGFVMEGGSARIVLPLAALSLTTVLVVVAREATPGEAAYGVPLVAALALGALREEVAFRGFLLHGLTKGLGATSAILVTSMLFAAYHFPRYLREHRPPAEMAALMLVAFGVGVFLCLVRIHTGSIWLPAIIHGLWNILVDVGHWTFPAGELPDAYVVLQTVPFALGVVMALFLAVRGISGLPGIATRPRRRTV
jgi:membrane protease YdiL (CAAX protease family)